MDAKEAQEQSERKWAFLMNEEDYRSNQPTPECGWCIFAPSDDCNSCPIVTVFGSACVSIQEYIDWVESSPAGGLDRARIIYTMLVANRQQLIAAGEEALDESERSSRTD